MKKEGVQRGLRIRMKIKRWERESELKLVKREQESKKEGLNEWMCEESDNEKVIE